MPFSISGLLSSLDRYDPPAKALWPISSDVIGAHERLAIVLSEFCPRARYRCGTSGVYVWAKLTLLLINM
jgi:hypothetical protein